MAATKTVSALERIQGFKQQIEETLAEVKTQLAKELQKAADTYKEIVSIDPKDLWKDPQYEQALTELGLMPTAQYEMAMASGKSTRTRAAGGSRVRVNPEDVLAFVNASKEAISHKSVADKFGCSAASAKQKLDELAKEKKIQKLKEDPNNPRSPVSYKAK